LTEVIERECGGVRWQVSPGLFDSEESPRQELLFGPGGLRLAEWLAGGAARVVKQAPHRTVYRVTLPGLDFHLKQYPVRDRRSWLRTLLRPSKARAEYDLTRGVMARGVPTVEPLAVGESTAAPRCSYLLTRTLPDAVPLNDFLDAVPAAWGTCRRARFRQRLAVALGELLATMHRAGVTHHDLHPGNLLLRLGNDGLPYLYLIDLHAVRLGSPLTWRAARDNLVILNRWFVLRSERGDRLRFWNAYQSALGEERADPNGDAAQVRDLEKRTRLSNLRFWRDQDRRCLGGNRHFRKVGRGAVAGFAVADLDDAVLAPFLADPDFPFHRPGVSVLKDSPTSSVVEFDLPTAAGPCRVVYKRFAGGTVDAVASLVRPAPALRSYVLGHGLRLRCLPTPRPLAVLHRHPRGLPRQGYLLTEKVPDAVDLHEFVDRLMGRPAAERLPRLRRLVDQVGRLASLLHERHLSHRDLKAANLLVSPAAAVVTGRGIAPLAAGSAAGEKGSDHVWFIDLVGARRHGKLSRGRRVQNLARLHASFHADPGVTRTDKLRFLRVYLRWGLRGRYGWKRWWRQVEEATRAKVWRNLRNGRPLV
jgi:tRNA A-37 threonylcarbamoyl transferase component Bud32